MNVPQRCRFVSPDGLPGLLKGAIGSLVWNCITCRLLPVLFTSIAAMPSQAADQESWLKSTGFGLMFHYECFKNHNSHDYNKAIDSFDVEAFADAVASTKAGHVIFVIGQHWGKYCAPNTAYEKLLGVKNGEWTSRRDLIMEIARALENRGIRLIIYMTARAPMRHFRVIEAMGDTLPTINGKPAGPNVDTMSHPRKLKGFRRSENQPPNSVFLKNWGDVCGEWSRRYGKLVSGWWFDGYKMEMKNAYQDLKKQKYNVDTWLAAVRSGNPEAELAFNAGAHPILSLCTGGKLCPHQTFTSGEQRDFTFKGKPLTPKNFPAPDGVVWHLLLPVSDGWGAGTKARFEAETLLQRINAINSQGGAVTLDTPIAASGEIPSHVLARLKQLGMLGDDAPRTSEATPAAVFDKDQFIVADGLAIEPFATEQLSNPCSIDVDDRGRVWVGEAANYRKKARKEGDRILILEDTNGDGRADLTKVFYQNPDIDGVHGVCTLGNEAIVSAPDRILLLTDTDGDDKADEKKLLFTGRVLHPVHGQHDHAIHAVMVGPDGRLYFNFGNFNAELRREDGSLVKDIYGFPVNNSRQPYQEGMVIRCELDGSRVEVLGHNFRNNWEVTVDSFGSMWQSDNDNGSSSCRVNFVMEHGNYGYRDERTGADYKTKRTNLEATMQRQMWHQNDPGVVPNLLITGFGAPTGILVYEGSLLPKQFHGQMIHAEPGRNTVWAFPTRPDGAGYSAQIVHLARGETDRDYRPCDVSVAPDGSLFIADWYDPVDCCHRTLNDAGRLFRVAPPGHVYSNPKYNYDSPKGAVAALRSPNLAARHKAWTALNRMGAATRPALRTLVEDPNPRFRARGLWVLSAIADTPQPAIELALRDESTDIRALALRIARRHQFPVEAVVKRLVHDKSALVRRKCSVSLHRLGSAEAVQLWTELATQYDGKDRWYLEALGIGEVGKESACLNAWRKRVGEKWKTAGNRDIVWRARAPEGATLLAELLLDPDVPAAEHPRLMRALDFHDGRHKQAALAALLTSDPKRNPVAWLEAFQRATPDFLKAHPDISDRVGSVMLTSKGTVTFVDLVARFNRRDMISHLMDMVQAASESEAGIRAVAQIIAFEDWDPIWKALVDPNRSAPFIKALGYVDSVHAKNYLSGTVTNEAQPEATRLLAISAMGNKRPQALELKRLMEQKKLPQEFMAPAIRALTLSPDPDTRMFAASRQHLIVSAGQRWPLEKLLAAKPDTTKGFAAFQKGGCINCHKIGDQGRDFGPALSAISGKLTSKQLFSAILNPSETISLGYEGVTVLTDDGKLQSGFVAAETKDTLTLRIPGGLTREIPRTTIEFQKRSEVSLMPKGIDAILSPQELVDVVGWLKRAANEELP